MKIQIISGDFGGRLISTPKSNKTHPMSSRARGAMFNSLGDITGKSVLDPFAGSGILSLEAISRGAAKATMIDNDLSAQATLVENVNKLGVKDKIKIIGVDNKRWSAANESLKFDLILCDPPYNNFRIDSIELLAKHLDNDGTFVLSYPNGIEVPVIKGLVLLKVSKQNYAAARLAYFKIYQ